MRSVLVATALAAVSAVASAQPAATPAPAPDLSGPGSNPDSHTVQPYVKSSNGVTPGIYQAKPHNTPPSHVGTQGKIDPPTGTVGTRAPRF
jgi:hypothetical protein